MTLLLCGSCIPILFSKPLFSRDLLREAYDTGKQCSVAVQVVPQGFWPSSFRKEKNPGYTQVWVWIATLPLSSSVKLVSLFSHLVMSDSLHPHGLQHARLPCPSLFPWVCSNSCPSSRWCHPTISSSVIPFSCLQSFPASGSFPKSQFFASGGQSIGASASASVLPTNIQGWIPLGLTGLISLLSKGFSTVFSNTTVGKH